MAYGDMAEQSKTVDDEIEQALLEDNTSSSSSSDELAALKAKMGIQ